jgi:hypothetical protein
MPNENFFGLSKSATVVLSIPITTLLIFSMSCFLLKPQNWKFYMKFVILGNLAYCLFTTTVIILKFKQLTLWGVSYFLLEILVILFIAGVEIMTLRK